MNQFDRAFELGKLYSDRGEFGPAIDHLREASDGYFAEKNFSQHLKCMNLLLRIFAEREQFDDINATKEKLQDLVLQEGFELNSKTYYTLAICASYKQQLDTAMDYFQKALAIALASDNKEDICHAIFGLAHVYASPQVNRQSDALKEIYNLQVFFQVYQMPDVQAASLFLNAEILKSMKKYDEAIEILWRAYDVIRETRNFVMSNYLMGALADAYYEIGDKDMARTYITLAQKSIDGENHRRLARMAKALAEKIGGESQTNFDLIFDEINHSVIEKKIGRIDFKNQFILLDLLRLFVTNQGTIYSKEFLVENVWKQPYDPAIHDNKIYVTIKRLRKLIEPDYEKPKYIFRAKNGYYMNKAARVHFEH
ncbi:winged helix-turn-helix domain-containing protein [Bdellovibrio svalbardensis]|uniref:Helix-turn-helix domain-containing protein n=1 Tax=Bdellovibrio svalbardensis TaxID=2972972 RepID=A0ABT6DGR1_9BACT|nr:helix-turn-helix domain-containing protein [Bdellovibrio svalbardensis]MDG0815104.1 helix-turn-helix domain-containing protein [Bdellovibrio svalbardensis]